MIHPISLVNAAADNDDGEHKIMLLIIRTIEVSGGDEDIDTSIVPQQLTWSSLDDRSCPAL